MIPSKIFKIPHYYLKQQEKKQWGRDRGGGHNIFVIYLGWGGRVFFSNGIGGGGGWGRQNFCLPHENVTARPPT